MGSALNRNDQLEEMGEEKKRRKGNSATEEEAQLIAAVDDRLSSLPDEIIHNILYRLDAPKQVALTSALSRRWLHLWRSYPVVEFRYGELHWSGTKFFRFAASARRLWKCRTPLDALRLSLPGIYGLLDGVLSRLLASALGADGGSPLEVVIRTNSSYKLPDGSFSHCSRTKALDLGGCDLNGLGTVSLHTLQVLHLFYVRVSQQSLYHFVGNAPNLESLSLDEGFGFQRLEVSASYFPKLKTLEIRSPPYGLCPEFELLLSTAPSLQRVVINDAETKPCKLKVVSLSSAPNLKFLRITSYCREEVVARPDLDDSINKLPSLQVLEIYPTGLGNNTQMELHLTSAPCLKTLWFVSSKAICKLNIESLSVAPNLKDLRLKFVIGFTQSRLDDLMSKFPYLESLSLDLNDASSSCGMNKIKLCSDWLRRFQLHDRNRNNKRETPLELEIDAPNLVSIHYSGYRFRCPGKINVVNVGSTCRFAVHAYGAPLIRKQLTCKWFLGLRQSLSTLSSFHLVMLLGTLNLSQQVSFDLGQAKCSSPPLIIQRLQLETTLSKPPKIQNDNPPAVAQRLQSERDASSSKLPDAENGITFLDGLFWACRPKYISITQDSDVNRWFAEVMRTQLTNRDVVNCCVGAKCWRHELRDVKIENAILDDMEGIQNEVSPLPKPGTAMLLFMLTWS